MINLEIKNIKSHPSLSLAKANASRDLQINFNQAEDALTIPAESRHDYKCGSTTQSGRSMIEMLGVLAIIGVLSVGGIAGYSKAMMKYRINKTIEQITLIAGNVRTFWGPQKNYIGVHCFSSNNDGTCRASGCYGHSGVDAQGVPTTAANGCPIVKKAKIFPDEMITVTDGKITSITNPFGGRVSLDSYEKSKSGDNQAFYIHYYIHNEEACIELLSQDWSNANVKVIYVMGDSGDYDAYLKTPVSVDKAVEVCSKAIEEDSALYDSDNINLTFYFDVDVNSEYWKNNTWAN
ncbi:MAG: hypothetical protein IJ525_06265 [Alphaproteobacteria bacterium]|nr:hypothetical protein [Alphaproteobacteria bacterium]